MVYFFGTFISFTHVRVRNLSRNIWKCVYAAVG